MTQYGAPFDGVLVGDATVAPYSSLEWARLWALQHGVNPSVFANYGVIKGTGGGTYEPLDVRATSPVSSNVEVQIGAAFVNGRFYETTALVALTVASNSSGNPRIDTVILRVDYVAQTVRLVIKQGTPAGSPARPTLQQDATFWEIPLADIAVANGFATISQSNISDRCRSVHAADRGWQPYAYPINYIPNGNYDASTTAIGLNQGIAVPFLLTGNMLLQSITVRYVGGNLNYDLSWGLYIQDLNDGNTAEKTLRRVANGTAAGAIVTTGNLTIIASPVPAPVAPGAYWLALKSNSGAGSFTIGRIASSGFGVGLDTTQLNATSVTIGQTLDMTTNWAANTDILPVRLNGRVFGQTAAF